jgi:hypothetical protein
VVHDVVVRSRIARSLGARGLEVSGLVELE